MSRVSNDKKKAILDYLSRHIDESGYPPSVREIRDAIGFKSTSTVHSYIKRLEKDGYIKKDASKPRALKIICNPDSQSKPHATVPDFKGIVPFDDMDLIRVPVLGRITAGQPILAVENIEDEFPIPSRYTHNSDSFMLKVEGESMVNAGILDGDLILVRKQPSAENGEIVVAMFDDTATVKRFYRERNHIRLQPENDFMDPIIVNGDIQIIGKVIGVMRFF